MKNGHLEIEDRVVEEKGGGWALSSMSEWVLCYFPGERAQVLGKTRNVKGESQCSVELKQGIIWKIQSKTSGGEIRFNRCTQRLELIIGNRRWKGR